MRARFFAYLLAVLTSFLAPQAAMAFDFSALEGMAGGFVECILPASLSPGGEERVLVRLDSGLAVEAASEGLQRFEPGERVRVLSDANGARVTAD